MLETPKNLTRNILLGMFLGFVVGAIAYYFDFIPSSIENFIQVYIFNLGGAIFINLLKMLIVPLVFFFTSFWNILFKQSSKSRQYNL